LNIGLGLISIPIAITFILFGVLSRKKNNQIIAGGLLVIGAIILSVSILLLTGIYDPYANHIR
jgi:hypothetical protein